VIHDTYVRTKAPVLNETHRTILFNFKLYLIPEGAPMEALYAALATAVTSQDLGALRNAVEVLQPYEVQQHIKPAWRQTEIYDPFDKEVVH